MLRSRQLPFHRRLMRGDLSLREAGLLAVGVIIFLYLFVTILFGSSKVISIWPVGDSITQGKWARIPYRPYLWRQLTESEIVKKRGLKLDFVGTNSNFENPYSASPDEGKDSTPAWVLEADNDHNGYSGWGSDDIFKILGPAMAVVAPPAPDIVLFHVGTNDLGWKARSVNATLTDIGQIVKQIHTEWPGTIILLAQIIPCKTKAKSMYEKIEKLNKALETGTFGDEQLVAKLRSNKLLYIVDHFSTFSEELFLDELHPNQAGASHMAQTWARVIENILESKQL